MIGRPGAGVLQMNGQPTAQNNRECGADGDLPGFRNWDNPAHVAASWPTLWNVDAMTIPHWAPPTHAMQIFRYAETGLDRVPVDLGHQPRRLACPSPPGSAGSWRGDQCFVVVQDLFLTETAQLADVVLPAAGWGEKTGTLHQRQPHRPPLREGRRPAGRGAQRPRHLPRSTPTRWASPTATARR